MKKHLSVLILFGLTVVALIHILMDVFANNLIFRGKKEAKLDARNTYLHACVSRFFHGGQLPLSQKN